MHALEMEQTGGQRPGFWQRLNAAPENLEQHSVLAAQPLTLKSRLLVLIG